MALIIPDESLIKPDELNLDYYLEALPLVGARVERYDMTGKETYRIGAFTESQGFGITSIDIDIKPNLQPIININFKDLYGNLVFSRDTDYKFNSLFQSPYPRFVLYVKGYLGQQVGYNLQVKSIKTNFQPSDGSFEIKGEFIPNIFGFFNDIPYQYLFAVPKLKEYLKDVQAGITNNSIIQIAQVGTEIQTSIRQVEDKYINVKNKLSLFDADPLQISLNYNDKKNNMSFESIFGDEDLNGGGFSAVTFNIDFRAPSIATDDFSLRLYGSAILASINSPTKIVYKDSTSSNEIRRFVDSEQGRLQADRGRAIISGNLEIIQKVSTAKGFSSVKEFKVDTQTIYNVMTKLAGDCAYVLGYILEGALNGYNSDASRESNQDLIGSFYPLVEKQFSANSPAFGQQTPFEQAKLEIGRSELFVRALMEGINVAKQVIEERQKQDSPPVDVPTTEPTINYIPKTITNLENLKENPYNDNIDSFIVNMIQRCGLMSCGYSGSKVTKIPDTKNPGKYLPSLALVENEFTNMREIVLGLRGTKAQQLKKFCVNINNNFFSNGEIKATGANKLEDIKVLNADGRVDTGISNIKEYFASFFKKFPRQNQKDQFRGNDPNSLISNYTYNNNILYYNANELKKLLSSTTQNSNNILQKISSKPQILTYVPNSDLPIEVLDPKDRKSSVDQFKSSNIGGNGPRTPQFGAVTGVDQKVIQEYYAWYFFESDDAGQKIDLPDTDTESIFINYDKIYKGKDGELIVKYLKDPPANSTKTKKADKNDAVVRLFDQDTFQNPDDWVVDLNNQLCRAYLKSLCGYLLDKGELNKTDAEKDKSKIITEGSGSIPVTTNQRPELSAAELQRIKDETLQSVYVQFHHISHAWISVAIAQNTDNSTLPSGTDIQLRNKLEEVYKSNNQNADYYMDFSFPVISNKEKEFDVRGAIINTDSLLENNTETSTLNMMQNICSKNNFLLQPIPGGVTKDLDGLFTPFPVMNYSLNKNSLSIIWSPTPENRLTNNKNQPIYPEKGFKNMPALLDSIKPIPCFQFGSPNNIILKSVKAGTDDNKITSESLNATSDIVNNTNSNKKKGFDCSMISVLQGRSYSISLDMIGNAQIYPTMHLVLDGLPIFTGLYLITDVQHKLTPNNMETSVGAIKMKYNGKDKFVAIPPITKRTIEGFLNASNNSQNNTPRNTQNLCNGGKLNEEFCKKVKDKKITKSSDIDPIIKEFTNNRYSDFVTWFNSEIYGKCPLAKTQINKDNFDKIWNEKFISILWNNYGTSGINFLEFVTIHCIIYNEIGGDYKGIREQMNDVNAKDSPGVAYAFDTIGEKISYNSSPNLPASDLFANLNYITAHESKKFGDDIPIRSLKEWSTNKPGKFPVSAFADVPQAVATTPTFINEADFYKFSGRGLIKTRWRTAYKSIVEFVMSYSGSDAKIINYKSIWSQSPYDGDIENILNISSNSDWDDLFDNTNEIQLVAFDIFWKKGGKIKDSQYIDMNPNVDALLKSINNVAKSVSDKADYLNLHQSRVFIILDQLYPEGAFKEQSIPISFGDFGGDLGDVLAAFFQIILQGESKSYDDYNYYTSGGITSFFQGRTDNRKKFPRFTKLLSEYTLAEIRDFQEKPRDSQGDLHAVGRYQIIPDTLEGVIKSSGVSRDSIFNKEIQEILGLQLLKDGCCGLWKYLTGKNDNLEKASQSLSQIWSSVGVPVAQWVTHRGKTYWVEKNKSYYRENTNSGFAKVTSEVAQGALIQLRKAFLRLGVT